MISPIRKEAWFLIILSVLAVAGYFSVTWMTGDEARYFVLSRSLAHGTGYTLAHLPIDLPENITPPAYPLYLAAVLKVTGDSVLWAKLMTAILFFPLVLLLHRITTKQFGNSTDRLSAVILGIFPAGILTITCWFMAELPFMLLSYAALSICLFAGKEAKGRTFFIVGALAVASYYARAAGLAVLASVGAYLLFSRQWKLLSWFMAGVLITASPWVIRSFILFGSPDPYIAYLSSRTGGEGGMEYPWHRIVTDITNAFPVYYAEIMPVSLFPHLIDGRMLLAKIGLGIAAPLVKWGVILLVSVGFIRRCFSFSVLEGFWVFYWLLVCALPLEAENKYYLFPVFPLAGMYMVAAFGLLTKRVGKDVSIGRGLTLAFASYVLLVTLGTAAVHGWKEVPRWKYGAWEPGRYSYFQDSYYDAWGRFVEAGVWLKDNTEAGSLVASRKPQHMFVFSERKGWGYHTPDQVGETAMWDALTKWDPGTDVYLVEDGFGRAVAGTSYGMTHSKFMAPLLEEHGDQMELMHETGDPLTRIWRIKAAAP